MRLSYLGLFVVLSLASGVRLASAATIDFTSAAATEALFRGENRFTLEPIGYAFLFNYLGTANVSQHGSIALWNHNACTCALAR